MNTRQALVMISGWALSLSAHAAEQGLTFYAPFDGAVQAAVAKGDPRPQVEGMAAFEPGIKGQALFCGEAGAVCAFRTGHNLSPTRGTVSLWVKPLDWEPAERKFHVFFETRTAGWLLLYKYWEGGWLFLCGKDTRQYVSSGIPAGKQHKGEWIHLAATWSYSKIRLFVNGKPGPAVEAETPAKIGPLFHIGDRPWHIEREGGRRTLVDEVRIYDYPMTVAGVAGLYEAMSSDLPSDYEPPLTTSVRCAKPPTIDGRFAPGEWDGCTCVTGFVEARRKVFTEQQTQVSITHDAQRLYVAYRSSVPRDRQLVAKVRDRDGSVYSDDAIELFLSPDGQRYAQFVGNSIGTIHDGAAASDPKWDGEWTYACGVEDGIWTAEVSVAYAALGADPPKDGESWRVNFCRDWQEPTTWTSWSRAQNFHKVNHFGTLVFRNRGPVVRVESLGDLSRGLLDFGASLTSTGATCRVRATMAALSPSRAVATKKAALHLKPGAAEKLTFTKDVADTDACRLSYALVDAQTDAVYARASVPFAVRPTLEVKVEPWPSKGRCDVTVDIGGMRRMPARATARAALLVKADRKPIAQAAAAAFTERALATCAFDIAALKAGDYVIKVDVLDADAKVFDSREKDFTKPASEWWRGNKIGVTEDVPPPWTPLEVQAEAGVTVTCWGRRLEFGDRALPDLIVTRGEQILAAPVRLRVRANGKDTTLDGEAKLIEQTPAKVVMEATAQDVGIRLTTRTTVEFDGLMVFDIELAPAGATQLDAVTIELPLRLANAKYKHVPGWASQGTGAFGATPEKPWISKPIHYLWIGDADRGITWFTESHKGWVIKDQKRAASISVERDAAVLRINVMDTPTELTEPLRLMFGLHPTPVKPLPKGWRGWGIGRNFNIVWTNPKTTLHFGYPVAPDPAAYQKMVDRTHKAGKGFVPYSIISMLSVNSDEWKFYGPEWNIPGAIDNYCSDVLAFGCPIRGACPACPEWRDFIVAANHRFVTTYGLDGLYHDHSSPKFCRNASHGCDGKLPILAWRELYKRIYVMLKSLDRPTYHVIHNSGSCCTPMMSFCDAYVSGEQFSGRVKDDYLEVTNLDFIKAELTGRQWGVVPMFLPELKAEYAKAPVNTEKFMSLMLLHDISTLWLAWCDVKTVRKIWDIMSTFGTGEEDLEFVPYWAAGDALRLPAAVTPPDGDVLVSTYVRRGKGALVVVGNVSKEPKRVTVSVSPREFGLGAVKLSDPYRGEALAADGRHVTLEIAPRNFRMVLAQPR